MLYNLSLLSPTIRQTIENNAKLRELFSQYPETLLSIGRDAKTVKGEKMDFLTGILYLSPADISGHNLCPMAFVADCAGPCLFTAGRGAMSNVFYGRLRKTLYWQQYQDLFLNTLSDDIAKLKRKAAKIGFNPVVRLNGTSDIRWEKYGIIQSNPDIQFMDYTKLTNRRDIPGNYDLTFSYSGVNTFTPHVQKALENNMRLAVVFRDRETVEYMLENGVQYLGRDIVDGDATDLRFLEPQNVVSALYAKGRARYDGTGFVIDMPEAMRQIAA
jgi:hypothetical protein